MRYKTLILQGFRLLRNKIKRDRKMRNTWTHLMVSDLFYLVFDDTVFCLLDDKPYCPLTSPLFKLDFGNYILCLYKTLIAIFCVVILDILYILYHLGDFCKQNASTIIKPIFDLYLDMYRSILS